MEFQSARQLLQKEFTTRCEKNPSYSLRSFAKSLGISHTVLSLVMSAKRPLSKGACEKVSERLNLGPVERQKLLTLQNAKSKKPIKAAAFEFQKVDLATFELISNWIHYAILSLLEVEGSEFEPKWLASRLGANEMQVRIAMDCLKELGLVKETKGKWKQTGKAIKVENNVSTVGTKKFQKQLLEKAIESLENDPIEVRDFSSMTLAMDPKDIPYAKERIRQFRRELTAELEVKGKPREVYNLTVQIYPVTKEV